MKKRTTKAKVTAVIMTAAMAMATMTGCGKPTVESLTKAYVESLNEAKTADMTMGMKFTMKISEGDQSLDMDMDMKGDILYEMEDKDNFKASMNMDMGMSLMGMSEEVKMESYYVAEDGEVTAYSKEDGASEWTKEEDVEFSVISSEESDAEELIELLTLEEETVEEAGKECYVLKGTVTGEDVPAFGEDAMGMDFDTEDLKFDVTIKMDKKEKKPVQLLFEVDEEAFTEAMKDSMAESFGSAEVEVEKFEISIDINSLDEKVKLDIPEEVFDAKEAEGLDDLLDGLDEESGDEQIDNVPVDEDDDTDAEDDADDASDSGDETVSLEKLETMGFDVEIYKYDNEYGNDHVALITNNNNNNKTVDGYALYIKGDEVVAKEEGYLHVEAGQTGIMYFFGDDIDSDYDSIEYEFEQYDMSEFQDEPMGSQLEATIEIDDEGNITGEIKNNSDKTVTYPYVEILFFDRHGTLFYQKSTYTDAEKLAPGESSPISTYVYADDMSIYQNYKVYVFGSAEEEE